MFVANTCVSMDAFFIQGTGVYLRLYVSSPNALDRFL